jgi:hypothetical protein
VHQLKSKSKEGEGGVLMDSIFRYLISCKKNLELKFYIVFKSLTEKLHFSTVANILKTSVLGFFVNLILCPQVPRKLIDGAPRL